MKSKERRQQLKLWAQSVQAWKDSGKTEKEYAELQGLSFYAFHYRVRAVRREAPELLDNPPEAAFCEVPEAIRESVSAGDDAETPDPVLVIETHRGILRITNDVHPELLKMAAEVMLSC